jgi:glycosyltransferase involved in cell wall biosynthesis
MVNIVMIAKSRNLLTYQALSSLTAHTDQDLFNLTIVVDDTPDLVLRRPDSNVVIVQIEPSRGIVGLVRNIGADFARRYWGPGDWLYFSDNDVYFHLGWLGNMVEVAEGDPYCRILGGARHPFHGVNSVTDVVDAQRSIEHADAVAGYSMLMRWATWDTYGPFDQHAVGVGQSEDFAICQKINKANDYYVGYVSPPVLTVTGLTNTLGEKVPGWEQLKALVPEGVIAR